MGEAAAVLEHVRSSDGTRIAYWRSGEGPPIVLVHGTTSAHWSFRFIVPALVDRFSVYTLDRRGRGESGDQADYAIEREFEDVAAVVDSIHEPAGLFGHSYGATVALGTALVARCTSSFSMSPPRESQGWCRARRSNGSKTSSPGGKATRRSSTRSEYSD